LGLSHIVIELKTCYAGKTACTIKTGTRSKSASLVDRIWATTGCNMHAIVVGAGEPAVHNSSANSEVHTGGRGRHRRDIVLLKAVT